MSPAMFNMLLNATWQTLLMVMIPTLIAFIFGLPLGVVLCVTQKRQILEGVVINRLLAIVVNGIRSIPFIILMVAITPITQIIAGTSIGTTAAMVPLSIAAIPFYARIVESALAEVPAGLIEASTAMGASVLQIIWRVLLPESRPALVRGLTLTMITLVGYSAMAGAIGGGGLGDLGVRYGYDRFEIGVMIATVAILIVVVQLLQVFGDWIARKLTYGRE